MFLICSGMESVIRERLRLTLSIALSLLPRWAKHDFGHRAEPQHGRAKEAMVDALVEALERDFEVDDKADRPPYRGWGS